MKALRVLAAGEDPDVDELNEGLGALQSIVLEIHEARGPLLEVDISTNYTPSEEQRLRVKTGSNVVVTMPVSVPFAGAVDPYDYGFLGGVLSPPVGSTQPADGYQTRPPRDGARIEVVDVTHAISWYRGDIGAWQSALGLTLDGELPVSARYTSSLASLVAERLLDTVGSGQMTPALATRIARGRTALFVRPGVWRDPVRAEYF